MNATEIDTLHILPLSQLPLESRPLRQARLVKNARLESMVELFCEHGSGSGQVPPHRLNDFFEFEGRATRDFDIICQLGKLTSYDVCSVRVSLRRLGIAIEDLDGLRLSDTNTADLNQHMTEFTRPLMRYVYGNDSVRTTGLADLMRLIADPNAGAARENLRRMAHRLEVELTQIPKFLADYADVYMSLTFYHQCLERITPLLAEVMAALNAICTLPPHANDPVIVRNCVLVRSRLKSLVGDVTGVLETFRSHTQNMWENLSADQYRETERMVLDHQKRIGDILCALTVKMNAWNRQFPVKSDHQLSAKAAFVMSEIKPRLSEIQSLLPDRRAATPRLPPRT